VLLKHRGSFTACSLVLTPEGLNSNAQPPRVLASWDYRILPGGHRHGLHVRASSGPGAR